MHSRHGAGVGDGMGAGSHGNADLCKMQVHRMRVAKGQDEPRPLALGWTDRAEDVGPLGALIMWRAGPGSAPRPAPRYLVLLAYACFVLEPEFDL